MEVVRFAKLFDHSIVRPDATHAEVARFAETAARLGTATLTVQPHYVRFAAGALRGSGVLVAGGTRALCRGSSYGRMIFSSST